MSKIKPPAFLSHQSCETLTGLTLEHLPQDGSMGRVRHFDKGIEIWQPDDRADLIYFLRRGQITVLINDPQGHEVTLQVIESGGIFGELCFCAEANGLWNSTARTVVTSEVLEFKFSDFLAHLQLNNTALNAVVFTFCQRLSEAESRNEMLAYRSAEERLGRLLLQLVVQRGKEKADQKHAIVLRVSHEELAQLAAMSRSHVTVTMGNFRRQGLVHYERNQPLIVNILALSESLGMTVPNGKFKT